MIVPGAVTTTIFGFPSNEGVRIADHLSFQQKFALFEDYTVQTRIVK